jgi:membrane protein DedA with SNARE-associated domain
MIDHFLDICIKNIYNEFIMNVINILLGTSSKMGYVGIVFLMTIESTFFPLPSELVIPPAAYLAQKGEMNIFLVIIAGIIGSLVGALINYTLAYTLGRKIIYTLANHKFARLLLINEAKIKKSEEYFLNHGNISTFIGRLIPGIRHLISIPAGFCKMKIKLFVFYTVLGATVWNIVLATSGYYFGSNQDKLLDYYKEFNHIVYFLLTVIIISLLIFGIIKIKNSKVKN